MKLPKQIDVVMQAYFSGKATPEQAEVLEAWLREDPAHVRLFVDLGLLDGLMLSVQKDEDAAAILATLAEAEENAEPDFSLLHSPAFEAPSNKTDGDPITFREWRMLAGYALKKGLRTKVGVIGSIAAVLVLGAVLYVSLFSGDRIPGTQEIADQTPTMPGVEQSNTVATLTNEHNAKWAERALARGSDLRAGQRLTLTAGFAEITTNRGAIAIIQAPATIELLDNNNALRLHAGKLVGICKTESSKGFVVKTDHADVTDLGTEFGVEVAGKRVTTSVFIGNVEFTTPGGKPQPLAANQTAHISVDGNDRQVAVEDDRSEVFEPLLARRYADRLAGLGLHIAGDVIWGDRVPQDLRHLKQTAGKPQLFLERRGLLLQKDILTDFDSRSPVLSDTRTAGRVKAGQRVDVYLLHLDSASDQETLVQGTIRFDRPILGVITTGAKLFDTDALLGDPSAQYPDNEEDVDRSRGCDSFKAGFKDKVRINGTSFELLLAVNGYIDQIRIVVASEQP